MTRSRRTMVEQGAVPLLVAAGLASAAAQGGGAASSSDHTRVAGGLAHALVVRADGSVLAWGENNRGQLGRGAVDGVNVRREPEVVSRVSGAVAVAAGEAFSLALRADGTVWSWGDNTEGQLGRGPLNAFPRPGQPMPPVPVAGPVVGLERVRQIAAGARFALALADDGRVLAWGDGQLGALGDGKGSGSGTHYAVPFPRPVAGLSNAVAIAAGSAFGLALLEDGSVWGWGANEYGQLGDDAVDFKATPVRLPQVENVTSIHASGRTGLARLRDGTVVAWGRNDCGLLGVSDSRLPKSARPVPVPGLAGVQQVAASHTACHAMALLGDGTVRGWGSNGFSQLSNGPVAGVLVTVPVKDVSTVAVGGNRSFFVTADRRVRVTGARMADLVDRVPREVASLDPTPAARCSPPAGPVATWTFGRDELSATGVQAADQKAALSKADAFRALLTAMPPDAVRNESEGRRFIRGGGAWLDGALAYGFRATYLLSVCDEVGGMVTEIGSTRSEASIVANDLSDVLETFGEPVDIGGRPVQLFRVRRERGSIAGRPTYETSLGRAVLVTREGHSPFVPVTRGEFLDALERRLQAQGTSTSAEMDNMVRDFEAQIAQTRQDLTGAMRDAVIAEMEKALAEMKKQVPANQAKLSAGVGDDVAEIRRYRQQAGPADLSKPAVLASFGFRGAFADDDAEAGRPVVRMNPGFVAGGQPRHHAHLLVVAWSWSNGHPQDEAWRTRFESGFPFDRLAALLDR